MSAATTLSVMNRTLPLSASLWVEPEFITQDATTSVFHGPAGVLGFSRARYAITNVDGVDIATASVADLTKMSAASFASTVTFIRPGAATYTTESGAINAAAIDEPRFDYTNGARQFLLEGATTNLNTNDLSIFSSTLASFVSGQSDPMGTNNAYIANEGTGDSFHLVNSSSITWTSGADYTISAFAKAGTCSIVQLLVNLGVSTSSYATFNLATQSVTQSNDATKTAITLVGDGWFRISMTLTAAGSGSAIGRMLLAMCDDAASTRLPTYAGTERTVYTWGWQVEEGTAQSSYVPTSGTAVTRAADNAEICDKMIAIASLNAWSLGLFLHAFKATDGALFSADTGDEDEQWRVRLVSGNILFEAISGGVVTGLVSIAAPAGNDWGIIIARDGVSMAMSINGSAVVTGTASATPSGAMGRAFLSRTASGDNFNANWSNCPLWPFRMIDADIQAKAVINA